MDFFFCVQLACTRTACARPVFFAHLFFQATKSSKSFVNFFFSLVASVLSLLCSSEWKEQTNKIQKNKIKENTNEFVFLYALHLHLQHFCLFHGRLFFFIYLKYLWIFPKHLYNINIRKHKYGYFWALTLYFFHCQCHHHKPLAISIQL